MLSSIGRVPHRLFVGGTTILWGTLTLLTGCVSTETPKAQYATVQEMDSSRYGTPYRVRGVNYYPIKNSHGYVEEGTASWYGPGFHGKLTSNQEVFDMHAMTAAHKTLPFDTRVRVVHLDTGREIEVRINDRGPFVGDRIIDLSFAAAKKLGMIQSGTARVKVVSLEETPSPAEAKSLIPESEQKFTVQLAVFKDRANAEQLKHGLENSWVQPYLVGQSRYYRVMVGRNENFDSALKIKDTVRQQGYREAFIVAEPPPTVPESPHDLTGDIKE